MNHYQLYGLETLVHILSLPRCIKGYLSLISLNNLTSQGGKIKSMTCKTSGPDCPIKPLDVSGSHSEAQVEVPEMFGALWKSQLAGRGLIFLFPRKQKTDFFSPQTIQISRMLSQRLKPEYGKTHQHFTR